MPAATLDIDSDVYLEVGRAFLAANDAVCDIVTNAAEAANCAHGMAGTDSTGSSWASDYDHAAWSLLRASSTVVDALGIVGDRLIASGDNHGAAEDASIPGLPAYPGSGSGSRAVGVVVSPPPTADGTPTDPPPGWYLISHLLAWTWPSGHPDLLLAVASGWLGASLALTDEADALSAPIAELAGQKSPEVPYALDICTGLESAIRELADQHSVVSQVCSGYAAAIQQMHNDVISELIELGATEAVIEIVGAIASVPSAGVAQIPTQSVAAARIAVTAGRVARILSRLAEDVLTLDNLIHAVNERILSVLVELQKVTAQQETLQAVTDLIDAGIPPIDLQANEDNNPTAHVIDKHVAKSNAYLVGRNIAIASTFTSLAAATTAVSTVLAASQVKIEAWLAGTKKRLALPGPLAAGAGRSYLQDSGQFVESTRVLVILERSPNGYFVYTAFPEP